MASPRRLRRFLRSIVTSALVVLAAFLFLLEEYCWNKLTGFLTRLSQVPTVRAIESRIAALGPFWAAALFLIPIAVIEPVKIFALFLMGTGHFVEGAIVFLGLKIFGTAALAWLFRICRPALLTVRWFARAHDWVISTKVRLYARVKEMTAWRVAIQAVHRVRIALVAFGTRRAIAAVLSPRPTAPSGRHRLWSSLKSARRRLPSQPARRDRGSIITSSANYLRRRQEQLLCLVRTAR